MNIKTILIIVLLLGIGLPGIAQKKMSKSRGMSTNEQLLEQAAQIKKDQPAAAIKLLERVIFEKSKRPDYQSQGAAYLLLGEIYESIEQPDLALERYEEAERTYRRMKKSGPPPVLYARKAGVLMKLREWDRAESNFTICVNNSTEKELTVRCQQGLADVALERGENDKSLAQLDYVQNNYSLDSIETSRVEASRSRNFSKQSNVPAAEESYYNSIKNLPEKEAFDDAYQQLKKAKDELLEQKATDPQEQLEIRKNTVNVADEKAQLSELVIAENLKISDIYAANNETEKAEDYIRKLKAALDKSTGAGARAEVFKKSFEINRNKGAINAAMEDLENYTLAKEEDLADLQGQLREQIEIVKNQQKIDLVRKDMDLEEKDNILLASQLRGQKILNGLLALSLLGALVFFYFLNKNVKAKRKANQLLLLKSLRTQMNPHFIFNALNSVNNFIAKNDEKAANKFLSEFSKLMRKVLDYSQKDFISLEEEVELNELYLKLEHFRFRDKFEYEFTKDVSNPDLEIPPMLIQPFIENAVWHGLRYKAGTGKLKVNISDTSGHLRIAIEDNGIGRKNSLLQKTINQKKYKSTGLNNISRRVALINELYNKSYHIEVNNASDSPTEPGTLVLIKIPLTS